MHQLQTLALDLLDHHTQDLLLCLLVLRQEYQSCAVLSFFGHRDTLQQNKLMWNLHHDTGTVASLIPGFRATVLHVFQNLQRIVHQLMAFTTMYVHHHTHTACVVFILSLI